MEVALRGPELEVLEPEEEGGESVPAAWRTAWPPVPPRSGCSRFVLRAVAEDAARNKT